MLEIICKECETVHRYEVSDNCSKCESSFNEMMNPAKKKRPYKLVAALFGITFVSGIAVDNVIFDTNHNVQAKPNDIYILYNSMSQCVEKKARLSTIRALNDAQYNRFAQECSKLISEK